METVGEFVLAQILPDVFNRVGLGRAGRQGDQPDVAGDGELLARVPACAVEYENGMCILNKAWLRRPSALCASRPEPDSERFAAGRGGKHGFESGREVFERRLRAASASG